MTTVADINNWINSIAPYDTMEEWDNSGFLVGDMQAPVRRCVLSLDATLAVVDFTVGMGAELLLTHHPLIFHGLKQVYTGTPDGFLTVGRLSQAMSVDDFAAMAGEVLESDGLRYTDTEALIETVAVCGGAGGEFWRQAQQLADCYLTGEVRYHDLLEAAEAQYPVLAAGHYETEYAAFMTLKERLEQAFPDVEFICAPQKNPVLTV